MSARLSRPRRTKVYDCNYNMGERYYKPVVDDLDRRHSTRGHISDAATAAEASFNHLRSTLADNESSLSSSLRRRTASRAMEDREDEINRRRPVSSLMEDYDSIFDSHSNSDSLSKSRALIKASMDESEDDTIQNNLRRLRAARAARQAIEDEVDTKVTSRTLRSKLSDDFSEKVLGTVGLKQSDIAKARVNLADDGINRRVLKVVTTTTTGQTEENPSWTRWCRMSDVEGDDYDDQSLTRARRTARARVADLEAELGADRAADAAAERARKTRARLADIEDEMEALTLRGAQREKRAADLKAFIQENEGASDLNSSNTTKSAMRVKKISSSVQAEKKTVTF